jgi:DNA-binding NarL/FixJ family response regulator
VRRGVRVLSPAIAKRNQQGPGFATRRSAGLDRLTNRESEVLQLIGKGFSNREMAAELRISIKTVEKHRQKVMDKLDIHEVAGLTRYLIAYSAAEPRRSLAA